MEVRIGSSICSLKVVLKLRNPHFWQVFKNLPLLFPLEANIVDMERESLLVGLLELGHCGKWGAQD